ncbi:carboxypeptidase-like regulatory domain-containing protein [Blastopirellula sp. JC732]|uniref:Carboxypeptidase-like regulatory domain-containing protein n=1 Tax=Blastopirellula sediminis TaxID=2894196 RepID=A0A9X1SHU8_9BACT|nr:carboxypeptidase-like regulatory domain-containing protein [Blastopirellula sediminis]MCC9606511.1 carboxypeptidase-like regulatory domain-containing protein [Blastopirellula sediminis]MCC9630191.1 carboxypeptidase-like regulatory domain-containing protein [Blastopirellula sediminis]
MFKRISVLVFAGLVAAAVGCGGSESKMGGVSGTVTLDGKPAADLQVTFTPQKGRPSSGVTDAEGKYELFYIRDQRGAEPGSHVVSITTVAKSSPDPGPPQFVEKVPSKYNVKTTLSADVAKGPNTIDFKLESK